MASIKIHKQMYMKLHPYSLLPDLFPITFYSVKALADQKSGDLSMFCGILHDVCSKDHHVFLGPREEDKKRRRSDVEDAEMKIETECPHEDCREPRSKERQLLVMDIITRLQMMWKHDPTRELFM